MSTAFSVRKMTADQTNSTVTLADIDGLTYTADANCEYRFEFMIPFSSTALTTGIALAVTGPASPTFITYTVEIPRAADGLSAMWCGWGSSSGDKVISDAVQTINTVYTARIIGLLKTASTSGMLKCQFASEVAASPVTVKTGAWGAVDRSG